MTGHLPPSTGTVVLDTNVVLDLLLFADPSIAELVAALQTRQARWLSTGAMRDELERVLSYRTLAAPMAVRGLRPEAMLERFDRSCTLQPVAPACKVRCSDPDDQPFIDLAVVHRATLLSKDKAVLRLRRRLEPLAVAVQPVFRLLAT